MLEENKISNIKCSYNYTVLYFVSIVCLHCHIMPLTMLYLYPHGLYSLLEFEIKSESESIKSVSHSVAKAPYGTCEYAIH